MGRGHEYSLVDASALSKWWTSSFMDGMANGHGNEAFLFMDVNGHCTQTRRVDEAERIGVQEVWSVWIWEDQREVLLHQQNCQGVEDMGVQGLFSTMNGEVHKLPFIWSHRVWSHSIIQAPWQREVGHFHGKDLTLILRACPTHNSSSDSVEWIPKDHWSVVL